LFERACLDRPNIKPQIAKGDFSSLLDWMKEKVYGHGARYDTFAIVEKATGKPLDTKAWEGHVMRRYPALFPAPPNSP
jgi:carboxypeptidase Taq